MGVRWGGVGWAGWVRRRCATLGEFWLAGGGRAAGPAVDRCRTARSQCPVPRGFPRRGCRACALGRGVNCPLGEAWDVGCGGMAHRGMWCAMWREWGGGGERGERGELGERGGSGEGAWALRM